MNKNLKIIPLIVIFTFFGMFLFYILNIEKFIIITTDSMVPTINSGDIIYFEYKNPDEMYTDPINGDILVLKGHSYFYNHGVDPISYNFMPPDIPVIHRAIQKIFNETDQKYYYETKGDNARYSDGCARGNYPDGFGFFILNLSDPLLIPESEIIGVFRFKIPFIGFLSIYSSYVVSITIFSIVIVTIFSKIFLNIELSIKRQKNNNNKIFKNSELFCNKKLDCSRKVGNFLYKNREINSHYY